MTRLFVSDVDGTLVGKTGRLSAYARGHLCRMLEDGLVFTVATARSVVSLAPILDGLPLRLPVIELNGAFATDLATGESLFCEALSPDIADSVLGQVRQLALPVCASAYVQGQQRLYPPADCVNEGMRWYVQSRHRAEDPRLRPAVSDAELLKEPLVCLTVIARQQPLVALKASIEQRFPQLTNTLLYPNPYQPGWFWLSVQSARANKAQGIASLCEKLGYGWPEITVFGDEVNDLPMFEAAGRSVAVDNALPALKACADHVIGAHHTDSVIRYLLDRMSERA